MIVLYEYIIHLSDWIVQKPPYFHKKDTHFNICHIWYQKVILYLNLKCVFALDSAISKGLNNYKAKQVRERLEAIAVMAEIVVKS